MTRLSRPGCINTPGIILAVLAALIITGFTLEKGGLLFNPGPLNAQSGPPLRGVRSHAEFTAQCGLCHAPFWGSSRMADRCSTCHADVAVQLLVPTSLHATLAREAPNLTCHDCHPDHRGADAALTILDVVPFPHETVGYLLASHQKKPDGTPFACEDCHGRDMRKFDQSICTTCHTQMEAVFMQGHSRTFGSNCLACHRGSDQYAGTFDHNQALFPLTGKHVRVPCEKCHANDLSLDDLKATPQDCNSCHAERDVHQGRLGRDCGSCHAATGWMPATFDHDLSAFRLSGKHRTLACESCHKNPVFQNTPDDCHSCHAADDSHDGILGRMCGDCHTTVDWNPTPFDHSRFLFQLTGKHISLDCERCHINANLKNTPRGCNTCHADKDIHHGNLGSGCALCHTPSNWNPIPIDHNRFVFKLTGKHTTLTCESCHVGAVFKNTPSDCNSCHAADDRHAGKLGSSCGDCHTTTDWTPVPFDHNRSTFKLTGKHTSLICESCHINAIFKGTPGACNACHGTDDIHRGSLGANCETCHTPTGWTPSTYDHSRSTFALTGKHSTLACGSCHANPIFIGTPRDCNSCHASDDRHHGSLGIHCEVCHSTAGWTPSTFDHNLSGFPLTGTHASLGCSQCHAGGSYAGLPADCVSCHPTQDYIHPGYGIYCGSCHNTTNWKAHFTHPGSCDVGANCDFHGTLGCASCHGVEFGLATCDGCHDRNTPPPAPETVVTWYPPAFLFKSSGKPASYLEVISRP